MKLLEHLQGNGVVTAPDGYGTSPVAAFRHLAGQVWSEHDPYFVLGHVQKTMTLQMEDGRKFRFFHRDLDGNIGLNQWIG
jgi:hypothetical protein